MKLDDYTCADARERLYEYLDGELGTTERAAVELHLDLCERCGPHFTFEARLLRTIRAQCRTSRAPAALRRRVDRLLAAL